MSRQYTKISSNKPPPVKRLVKRMPSMGQMLQRGGGTSFKKMGSK